MQIFVISSPSAKQRRTRISQLLQQTGLKWEFFDAIQGTPEIDSDPRLAPLRRADISNLTDQIQASRIVGRELLPGDIGCSLSHLLLHALIAQKSLATACILEDDAFFDPITLHEVCLEFKERVDTPMIVLLGHQSYPRINQKTGAEATQKAAVPSLNEKFSVQRPVEFPFLTHAYITNSKASATLARLGLPISTPIDWLMGSSEIIGIELLLLSPPIAFQDMPTSVTGRTYPKQQSVLGSLLPDKTKTLYNKIKKRIRMAIIRSRRLGLFRTSYLITFSLSLTVELFLRRATRPAKSAYITRAMSSATHRDS